MRSETGNKEIVTLLVRGGWKTAAMQIYKHQSHICKMYLIKSMNLLLVVIVVSLFLMLTTR